MEMLMFHVLTMLRKANVKQCCHKRKLQIFFYSFSNSVQHFSLIFKNKISYNAVIHPLNQQRETGLRQNFSTEVCFVELGVLLIFCLLFVCFFKKKES